MTTTMTNIGEQDLMLWVDIGNETIENLIGTQENVQGGLVCGDTFKCTPMQKFDIPMKYGTLSVYCPFTDEERITGDWTAFFYPYTRNRNGGRFIQVVYDDEIWYMNNMSLFKLGHRINDNKRKMIFPTEEQTKTLWDYIVTAK